MLRNNLELVVQYPERTEYLCRGFRGLHLSSPVYVVFDGAASSDQGTANQLGTEFCNELLRYVGTREEPNMPCRSFISAIGCHATNEPTCRKILVRPAASASRRGNWVTPTADQKWLQDWPKDKWEVVPIMPAGTNPSLYLPLEWQGINASFWTRDPTESLWGVIQRAGLSPEESRIFISYVRKDTTAIADQLFAALTEEGFDVFLDRTSVPVGVQFQERLKQDLVDKAMVVFLNSEGVSKSKWVAEEIATIKTYRLGLLELSFPLAQKRPDIDADFRQEVTAGDLIRAGSEYAATAMKLSSGLLSDIVERIKETHGRALHRRRYELIDNFAAALKEVGRKAQVLPDGTFVLAPSGSRTGTVVALTTRLPELGDFSSLHQRGKITGTCPGWLISPSPFFLAQRQADVSWLGGVCNIQHANEAQMTTLASTL
jgi:hypothetical protein